MVGGELVCSFMLVPPSMQDISLWAMLVAGILKLPFLFGLARLKRLLRAKSLEEGALNEWGSAFRVERMVVSPAMQGRGIGTRALQLAVEEADAAGQAVALSTNEERNVTFYSRLGFEVAQSMAREIDGESYHVWHMIRKPSSGTSVGGGWWEPRQPARERYGCPRALREVVKMKPADLFAVVMLASTLGSACAVAGSEGNETAAAFRSSAEESEASQCTTRRNVCIFDFDHTLKNGCCYHCCGVLPREAVSAVNECTAKGFDIAIASANLNYNFVRQFLSENFPPELTDKLYTEAVQTGQSYKTKSLTAVLRHYELESNPECAVFFDDLWSNKKYADSVGIPFEKVNPDYGVSMSNVKTGIGKARENCRCGV
ncbi:hypothetical protein A3770_01p04170 [Chloropicon primus]|uniref:N-acetyltransferase domain-containing protein n=1 Tax=Chloropicon primus TaxID=1764295 RepID=A0A5B8MC47_9CHLO|nr:hypothetical protein A3770_01p04170 [Chloropicon primus]|eukprot:QDZ17899.1 hypothetical protein A3770_01p04170 [Chloropicon primus]